MSLPMPESFRPDPKGMDEFKAGLLGQLQDSSSYEHTAEEKRLAEICIEHLTAEDLPGARVHRNTYISTYESGANNAADN